MSVDQPEENFLPKSHPIHGGERGRGVSWISLIFSFVEKFFLETYCVIRSCEDLLVKMMIIKCSHLFLTVDLLQSLYSDLGPFLRVCPLVADANSCFGLKAAGRTCSQHALCFSAARISTLSPSSSAHEHAVRHLFFGDVLA